MRILPAILAEILHLFVEDGALALALVAWCGVVGATVSALPALSSASAGPALVLGCAAILIGNVAWTARSHA